ncbi:hypothetical protein R0135_10470 [Congregibacter variabilis]|uniref:TolB amino-terminal domain-containing protein n=1 Tax=Congregibacter variabilis TaxID=3081200 RepID=A0ABZ0HZJ5_9GAMM|nr:hypothetical protein R0135_10470 [Congregibacter sp. IMCC43200]
MTSMEGSSSGLFAELRRRRVFRTLALYILAAWGLMQVADVLLPALGLPEASIRYLLFASIAGLPVALVFGWFFDITAHGIQRTAPVAGAATTEAEPLRSVDYLLLGALAVVLGLILYSFMGGVVEIPLADSSSSVSADRAKTDGPPMVGVIPFDYGDDTGDGKFFATGVHDDLLTRLTKVGGLRVISRTSVLQYAKTTKSIPQIGNELGADAILEGGVRIAGSKIRINAQLIDARSDEHLWAETYDRDLSPENIFAVQADIARAISTALAATLSPEEDRELDLIPTTNMAAYRAFHEIMQWRNDVHLTPENTEKYIKGLERAYELDPNFTQPMVEVVATLTLQTRYGSNREVLPRIEALIDRIGRIAPDSVDYYTAQGIYIYHVLKDYDRATAVIKKAQELAPSDVELINIQSWIQRRRGDFEGYLKSARQVYDLEPGEPQHAAILALRLMYMHRYDEALSVAESVKNPSLALTTQGLLQLRFYKHRNLTTLERDVAAVLNGDVPEGRRDDVLLTLFEVQLASQDFAAAQETLNRVSDIGLPDDRSLTYLPVNHSSHIWLYLITGDANGAAEEVEKIRRIADLTDIGSTAFLNRLNSLDRATILSIEGQQEEAIGLLKDFWRDPKGDYTLWMVNRKYACQMLAMIKSPGAADEALACLTDVLTQPSNAQQFLEPLQPAYNSLREREDFRALMAELGQRQGHSDSDR